jgi:hypothetical protein
MEVSGKLYAPAALPPEDSPRYSLDRRLAESQNRTGRCGGEKNVLAPADSFIPAHSDLQRNIIFVTDIIETFLEVKSQIPSCF